MRSRIRNKPALDEAGQHFGGSLDGVGALVDGDDKSSETQVVDRERAVVEAVWRVDRCRGAEEIMRKTSLSIAACAAEQVVITHHRQLDDVADIGHDSGPAGEEGGDLRGGNRLHESRRMRLLPVRLLELVADRQIGIAGVVVGGQQRDADQGSSTAASASSRCSCRT